MLVFVVGGWPEHMAVGQELGLSWLDFAYHEEWRSNKEVERLYGLIQEWVGASEKGLLSGGRHGCCVVVMDLVFGLVVPLYSLLIYSYLPIMATMHASTPTT